MFPQEVEQNIRTEQLEAQKQADMIKAMEQEELKLIQTLQKTQEEQKTAYEELENTLCKNVTGTKAARRIKAKHKKLKDCTSQISSSGSLLQQQDKMPVRSASAPQRRNHKKT